VFPFGTYQMRVLHKAPIEREPPPDARVSMPGPLLSEVQAELGELAGADERERLREGARAMLGEVEAAIIDEARDIHEHAALELPDERAPAARTTERDEAHDSEESDASDHDGATGPGDRGDAPVAVRHRFDRDQVPKSGARRVIVLRNGWKRRPRHTKRHGSDPPV
jgi:hypothetical protein